MARQIFVNFAVKDLYREATDHGFMYPPSRTSTGTSGKSRT
jgi:hypothetical protein